MKHLKTKFYGKAAEEIKTYYGPIKKGATVEVVDDLDIKSDSYLTIRQPTDQRNTFLVVPSSKVLICSKPKKPAFILEDPQTNHVVNGIHSSTHFTGKYYDKFKENSGKFKELADGLKGLFAPSFDEIMKERIQTKLDQAEAKEKPQPVKKDAINPDHYKKWSVEVIDMMISIYGKEKTAIHCEMCAFKYRMRVGYKKGNSVDQELKKATWYLNKAKELRTKNKENNEAN